MNKDSKTLIILSPGFPKDESDSTCLPFLQQFIMELKMQFPGLQVVVLAFEYPFVRKSYLWNGTRVFPFNGWKKGKIVKFFTWQLIMNKMRKIRNEHDVLGILSLWCGPCAYLGSRFAKKSNLQHFCWIQGQDAKKGNRYVPLIKPLSSELIAISDFIQSEFEKNYEIRPAHVVPAGINPSEFKTPNAQRDIDILGVGSLIPLKQYHLFIEIVYQLKQYMPGIRAVLCGKGPDETLLNKLIIQFSLQDNITLTGELPHAEVLQYMKRSKLFLHVSVYEGFSIACIEALYAGNHVLSFVHAMNYKIEHWHILLTKEQMTEKARSLLSSAEMEFNSVQAFAVSDSVQKIIQLFS